MHTVQFIMYIVQNHVYHGLAQLKSVGIDHTMQALATAALQVPQNR